MKFFIFNEGKDFLYFGQKRDKVRSVLDSSVYEFMKSEFDKNTSDFFYRLNINCFYNIHNRLTEIEIFSPNLFFIESIFNLLDKNNDDIRNFFSKSELSRYIEVDDDGVVFTGIGVSTVANSEHITECIYVDLSEAKRIYYNKL